MLPYWILFSAFATGAVAHFRRGEIGAQATPLLTIAALLTAAMIGFRFESGGDWYNYIQLFYFTDRLTLWDAILSIDPGYGAINWLANRLNLDFWAVNLVCGTILALGLLKFAKRQPNPWLAAVVAVPYLLIVVGMGYSRQAAAIGFILAGLAVVDRTSLGRFAIYIFFAAMFHKTAVVVLPLVALASVRHRFAILAGMGGLGAVLFVVFLGGDLSRMTTMYIDSEATSEGAGIRVAMNLVPAMIFLVAQRRFVTSEPQRLLWRNFSYAALFMLFLLLVLPSSTVVDRLSLYLIPLQIFVFSRLPEAFPERKNADRKLAIAVVGYSAAIQFVWMNYATHATQWVPYQLYYVTDTRETVDLYE